MLVREKKIPGGKLVRVEAELNGSIKKVRITGDFFVHPEEAISEIESCLNGLPITSTKEEMLQRIERATKKIGAELVGFSEKDIAEILYHMIKEIR